MSPARNRRRLRPQRGASTVEVALAMILLIPTVLYSAYVGEAFMAASRAQEAEIAAGWELTAYRLHDFENGYDGTHYRNVSNAAAADIRNDLAEMDSYNEGSGGQRLVVSFQTMGGIQCTPWAAPDSMLTFHALPVGAGQMLHRGGYVLCQANVNFDPQFIPHRLRGGFASKKDLLEGALATGFPMCGNGTTVQGCSDVTRGVMMLTDDWGLEDGQANPVGTQQNEKYFRVGRSIYNTTRGTNDVAGGIGTQQIKEALLFLMDDETDFGQTSRFKFGFYNPMQQGHQYPDNDHRGNSRAHMVGWEDEWSDGTNNYASMRDVHRGNNRHNHHYLGHPDNDFLDSPP